MKLWPVMLLVLLAGCVNIQGESPKFDANNGFYVEQTFSEPVESEPVMQALLKGSIYETGEFMSVFGTCLDMYDQPVTNSYANLAAWYPNGTQFIFNDSMTELQTGYFLWTGTMYAVQGTYLTEMTCGVTDIPELRAVAYGEWQNPLWVARLANITADIENLNLSVDVNLTEVLQAINDSRDNLTITIGELEVSINDSFEITWDLINNVNATLVQSYNNLTTQIYNVGVIANGSVDRNDSLLYYLLLNLTQQVQNLQPVNYTGIPVNWTETPDPAVYYRDWSIRVDAYDPDDNESRLTYPDVLCDIATRQTPTAVRMDDQGNHFVYEEFIYLRGSWNWTVSCYWA